MIWALLSIPFLYFINSERVENLHHAMCNSFLFFVYISEIGVQSTSIEELMLPYASFLCCLYKLLMEFDIFDKYIGILRG